MSDKPPLDFGFDISVKADKKKRARARRGMSGASETSTQICQHPDCKEPGLYRAPLNPDNLDEFRWFCLNHIRQFNQKWNFFENHSEEELQKQFAADRVWERPTEPLGKQTAEQRAWARLGINDPHEVLGDNATMNPGKGDALGGSRRLPVDERKAIDILEAKDNWTKVELRKKYKSLIKELHPDLNGGDRSQEEFLQKVVWAWDQVKDSSNFK